MLKVVKNVSFVSVLGQMDYIITPAAITILGSGNKTLYGYITVSEQ